MPQHPLVKALLSRQQPRDPVKWGGGTQGDQENALNIDDFVADLLNKVQDPEDDQPALDLGDFPPTPENKRILDDLQQAPQGITQQMFDRIRASKWAKDAVPDSYERVVYDQTPVKGKQ